MKQYSQYGQDIYVVNLLNNKFKGFFVDVGAAHPTQISNTYLLESEFAWNGICIDADEYFVQLLKKQRQCTSICACIFDIEKELIYENIFWNDNI